MSWDKLSMADRAEYIRIAVANGVTNLDNIRDAYNSYAKDNTVNKFDGTGNSQIERATPEASEWNRALYSTINPRYDYPTDILSAIKKRAAVRNKLKSGDIDRMSYVVRDSVADAAWRKYNKLPYDDKYLPKGEPDTRGGWEETVRLPPELEKEIPTDTTMLKNRIAANEAYVKNTGTTPYSVWVALNADKQALKALRETYETGEPRGISEFSHNSRNLGITEVPSDITPLNVLGNFNIRYDKDTNRMYYSDTYNFDALDDTWYYKMIGGLDKYLEGNPFRIRGYIDLPKKKK